MNLKKLLIPLMVLLIASQALAAPTTITTTMTSPDGHVYFPVINNEKEMDVTMTIIDSNAENSIHTVTIQYDPENGDGNTFVASDVNLSSSNCTFGVLDIWSGAGASCTIKHTFPRTGKVLTTQTYILDVNVFGKGSAEVIAAGGAAVDTFGIDNQRVNASILAILTLSTLILAGILILILAGFLGSITDSSTMVLIAVIAIGALIGILLVSEFLLLLTP